MKPYLIQHIVSFAEQRAPELRGQLVGVALHGLCDGTDVAKNRLQQPATQGGARVNVSCTSPPTF